MSVFIVFDAIENPLHNTDDDCVVVVSNDALHHLVRVPLARLNLCTTRFQLTHALSMPSQSESVASLLLLRAIADSPHVEAEVSGQRVLIRGLRCGLKQLECVVAEMMLAKNDTSIDSFCRALALLGGRDVAVDSSLLFASVTLQSSANSTKIRVLRSLDKNDDLFVSLFPCHDLNGTHGNKLAKCIDDIMALAARVGAFPSASVLMLFVDSDGVRLASTAHGKLILQAFADVLLQCAEGSIVPKDTGAQFFMALSTSHFAHSSIVRHTLHFLRRQKVVVVGSLQSAVLSLAPNQCVRKWLQPANDITSDAFVGLSIAKPIESVESFVHRVMGLDVALELFPTLRRTFVGDQQIHTAIQIMRAVDFDGKVAVATLMPVCLESADAALKLWRSRVDWCALPLRLECASGGSDSTPLACRAQRHNALQLELSHCRDIDTRVRAVCDADQVATIFERHSHVVAVLPGARRREWSLDLSEPCIVVFVWLKGWMPDGEEALPTRICGLPVDVREASCKPLGGASIRIFAGQDKCVFPGASMSGVPKDAGTVGGVLVHKNVHANEFFALTAAHCVGEIGDQVDFPARIDRLPLVPVGQRGKVYCRLYGNEDIGGASCGIDAAIVTVDASYVLKSDSALLVPLLPLQDAALMSKVDAAATEESIAVGAPLSYKDLWDDDKLVLFGRASGVVFDDDGSIQLVWSCGAVRDSRLLGETVSTADWPFYNQLIFMFVDETTRSPKRFVQQGDSGSIVFAIRDGKLRAAALVHRMLSSEMADYVVATPIEVILNCASAEKQHPFSFTL